MCRTVAVVLLLAVSCSTAFGRELQQANTATGATAKAADGIEKATEVVDLEALMAYKYSSGYDEVKGFGCLRRTIETHGSETLAQCKAECNKDARCGAFTFSAVNARCYIKPSCVPDERKAAEDNDSYVKKTFTPISDAEFNALTEAMDKMKAEAEAAELAAKKAAELAAMIPSFLNEAGDYEYTGEYTDLKGEGCLRGTIAAVFVDDMDACKEACNKDIRCGAVTFNIEKARCYMKPNCKDGEREVKDLNDSAFKVQFESPSDEALAEFLEKNGIEVEEETEEENEEAAEEAAEEEAAEETAERTAGTYKFEQGKRCVPPQGSPMLKQMAVEATKDCRDACDENPSCTHYAFRNTNKMCRLFSDCENLVADALWFTAVRTN